MHQEQPFYWGPALFVKNVVVRRLASPVAVEFCGECIMITRVIIRLLKNGWLAGGEIRSNPKWSTSEMEFSLVGKLP